MWGLGKRWLLSACLLAVSCGGGPGGSDDSPARSAESYNVVVFLTDDQRSDTVFVMDALQLLVGQGTRFTSAYLTTPACAPTRASLLSGGYYAYNSGVLANVGPDGGWYSFTEENTLALRLQRAGITTGFVGKYINGYDEWRDGAQRLIPPGWDFFVWSGLIDYWNNWSDVLYLEGSSGETPEPGRRGREQLYITEFQTNSAMQFLQQHGQSQFFLFVNYDAPHLPALPMPVDEDVHANFLYTGRAFEEPNMLDKPAMIRERAALYESGIFDSVESPRTQLDSLLAVDRSIERIVETVDIAGKSDNTIFIFLSDNGVLWGEHNLTEKSAPYEEAIHTPLYFFGVPVANNTVGNMVAANLDVPATVLDLFGIEPSGDGISLSRALRGEDILGRPILYLENYRNGNGPPFVWTGVIEKVQGVHRKYVRWQDGDIELYDLIVDPFEENSLHDSPNHTGAIDRYDDLLNTFPNVAILDRYLPSGATGVPYSHAITAAAGTDTGVESKIHWSVSDGELPPGIQLDSESGELAGIPTIAGNFSFVIRAERQDVSEFSGLLVRHSAELGMEVF